VWCLVGGIVCGKTKRRDLIQTILTDADKIAFENEAIWIVFPKESLEAASENSIRAVFSSFIEICKEYGVYIGELD
jgi:hypothetical protein